MTDGLGFFELLQLAEELGSELSMAVQDGQHSGPGGHFTIAAVLRLISRQILVGARDEDLFIEDEDEEALAAA